jgi:hypothetical protein
MVDAPTHYSNAGSIYAEWLLSLILQHRALQVCPEIFFKMAKITLEPSSILRSIPTVLPQGSTVASAPEALAVLIHAVNQALGLQLLGVSENENENVSEDGSLPTSWNARSPDFTLKYREPGSAQTIVFKIMKLGNKTQIHGLLEQARTTITVFLSIN